MFFIFVHVIMINKFRQKEVVVNMARSNQNWDSLGRDIQNVVDQAVNSRDYQQLNQSVRQVVAQVVDVGGDAIQMILDSTGQKNKKKLYARTTGKMVKAVFQYLSGIPLTAFAYLGIIGNRVSENPVSEDSPAVVVLEILLAVGGFLIYSAIKNHRMVNRFKVYKRTLGEKTYCSVNDLARSVGKKKEFVQKDLRRMINKGFFPEGHLDKEENTLIISHETYHYYEQCGQQWEEIKQQQPAVNPQKAPNSLDPQVQEVLDRGNAFIAQIRKCNDDIPGEEISEKISRIELLTQRIFSRAEAHPEIITDLKKLMEYYLPMTVKLLNAYADMDAQPVRGETIENSKREIEATLDTLTAAFEKLLDDLFEDTALDVSSDISVLNTLLAQEGLTEDELLKQKEQQER